MSQSASLQHIVLQFLLAYKIPCTKICEIGHWSRV